MIVRTEWPMLAPAIRRAGFTPLIVCPCCRAPASSVEGVRGDVVFVCSPCGGISWLPDADIDVFKEMLRRAGKM